MARKNKNAVRKGKRNQKRAPNRRSAAKPIRRKMTLARMYVTLGIPYVD